MRPRLEAWGEPSESARRCRVAAWSIIGLTVTVILGGLSILAIGRAGFAGYEKTWELALLLHAKLGAIFGGMTIQVWRGRRIDAALICFALALLIGLLGAIGMFFELPFEGAVAWFEVLVVLYLVGLATCLVNLARTWRAMTPAQRTPRRGFD